MTDNNLFFPNCNTANHPCKNCTERNAECHATCLRYKKWNDERINKPPVNGYVRRI